jgi:hypothetical protein
MHPSRRNLLLASAATAAMARPALSRAAALPPKYFVLVFANGGWDVTYNLDPKQGVTDTIEGPWLDPGSTATQQAAEEVVQYGNIPIQTNELLRPNASRFFETWYPQCHVINGIWTGSIAHAPCRIRLFTGSTNQLNADSATIFGYEAAAVEPLGTVDMSGLSFPGPLAATTGRIGFQSQIKALIPDPNDPLGSQWADPTNAVGSYPWYRASAGEQAGIDAFLQQRAAALGDLRADGGTNDARVAGMLESWDRAARFRAKATDIFDSLTLGVTPKFDLQCQMAVKMFTQGLCRSVVLGSGSDWDTHIANAAQHAFNDNIFNGLGILAQGLTDAGILEETLVVVMSEMTRTPQFNLSGGKDHHSHTSAMMFGGPVRGNAVSGATDDVLLESELMNLATGAVDLEAGELCKYDNFAAGILTMLGVDSEVWHPGVTPFTGAAKV